MTERAEIVRALEICATIHGAGPECESCPYYPRRGHGCMNEMMRGAAELLRPRVLEPGELRRGMAVCIERFGQRDTEMAIGGSLEYFSRCYIKEDDMAIELDERQYGTTWRAWTAEPSDEQREAAGWTP